MPNVLRAYCRDLGCFFFFNDTATTEIYTLSLHDALPISRASSRTSACLLRSRATSTFCSSRSLSRGRSPPSRSEEHTSELQSQSNLVCRLLLEKKNIARIVIAAYRRKTNDSTADCY